MLFRIDGTQFIRFYLLTWSMSVSVTVFIISLLTNLTGPVTQYSIYTSL